MKEKITYPTDCTDYEVRHSAFIALGFNWIETFVLLENVF